MLNTFYSRNMSQPTARPMVNGLSHRRVSSRVANSQQTMSTEMKRKIMIERVARDLFETLLLTDDNMPVANDVRQSLNSEFGEKLFFQTMLGSMNVSILRQTSGGREELSPAQQAQVLDRAWALTLDKVEETLL